MCCCTKQLGAGFNLSNEWFIERELTIIRLCSIAAVLDRSMKDLIFQMNVLANARCLLLAHDPQMRLCSNLNRVFLDLEVMDGSINHLFVLSMRLCYVRKLLLLFNVLFFCVKKERSGEIKIEM